MTNLVFAGDHHTIKAGFDVRRRHMGEFQTNRGNGRFNFSPNITNNPANNTGGHVMAAFLLGAPSLIEQDYLLADAAIRNTEYGVYVADDWRATGTLTLNLGLRYELDTPASEDVEPVGQLRSDDGDGPGGGPQRRERNRRASTPSRRRLRRVLASPTRLAQHTVVRGGAGIFWNTAGHGGNVLRLQRHVPFGPIYSFNPGTQFVTQRVRRRLSNRFRRSI